MQNPASEAAQNSNYLFYITLIAWGFKTSSFSYNLYWERRIGFSILFFFFFTFHTENRELDLPVIPFWGLHHMNSPFKNEQYT